MHPVTTGGIRVIAAVAAATLPHLALGQLAFGPPRVVEPSGGPLGLTAAVDVNGDGFPDLIGPGPVVLLNDGRGGFPYRGILDYPNYAAGGSNSVVAAGDVNGDGYPDIVSVDFTGFRVYLNDGTARFTASTSTQCSQCPGANAPATLSDLNGDHSLDLAFVSGTTVGVCFNSGTGGFAQPVFTAPVAGLVFGAFTAIQAADIDRDSDVDLIVAHDNYPLVLFFNAGNGTFPTYQRIERPQGDGDVAVADLNGDGFQDIVALSYGLNPVPPFAVLCIYLNQGIAATGWQGFASAVTQSAGGGPTLVHLALGDLNRDGRPDIVVSTKEGTADVLSLRRNAGDGTFPFLPHVVPTGSGNLRVFAFDADGDADADVVFRTASGPVDAIKVLLNQSIPQPPPAAPTLTSPDAGAVLPDLRPVLAWTVASGANAYSVQVSTESDFASLAFEATGVRTTTLELPSGVLEFGAYYFWRVAAGNAAGQTFSAPLNFRAPCLSDIDHNGQVDPDDLSDFITEFFTGCR